MSLKDLKKELYEKDFNEQLTQHGTSSYDPRLAQSQAPVAPGVDAWQAKKQGLPEFQKKAWKKGWLVVLAMVVVAAAFVGIYKYNQSAFSQNGVVIAISGPQEVDSGQEISYVINYQNNNRAALKGAVLHLRYPESFKPDNAGTSFQGEGITGSFLEIGDIAGKAGGKITFNGKAYSPKGNQIYLEAKLDYKPGNYNSQFTAQNNVGVYIKSSPIQIEVMAPQNIASGDLVDYLVTYKNIGDTDYNNIKVKIDYPDSFTFTRSNPQPSEGNNIFYVGRLSAGQEDRITVSGKLEGEQDNVKIIQAYIGESQDNQFAIHNEEKAETKIIVSPLAISQTVNGLMNYNANAGDKLRITINYKNQGIIGLRDVIITDQLDSPVLDYGSLEMEKGALDNNHKITWKAADIPGLRYLEPGQGGSVSYRINVKENIPVSNSNDKNFTIISASKIDSPDIPAIIEGNKIIAGNVLNIKLNSKLLLDVKGYYYDSQISNEGPVPPVIGQTTTYTIHWRVYSVSNDITDAKVEAVLPTGLTMTKKISPEDAHLTYNERNNSIIWEIGNMSAGTGIINSPKEVSFQVALTPAENQLSRSVNILEKSVFSAKDLFTSGQLSIEAGEKNTQLTEDRKLNGKYTVVNQ